MKVDFRIEIAEQKFRGNENSILKLIIAILAVPLVVLILKSGWICLKKDFSRQRSIYNAEVQRGICKRDPQSRGCVQPTSPKPNTNPAPVSKPVAKPAPAPKPASEKKPELKKLPSPTKTSYIRKGGVNCNKVARKDGSWSQSRILRGSCRISEGDVDFMLTMLTENPELDPRHISAPNHDGTRDHGIPQLNDRWHKKFIESPSYHYWDLQLKYGYRIYKDNPHRFCAYKVRHRSRHLLILGDV